MIPLGILASSVRRAASGALLAPTNLVATLVEPTPVGDPYWDNVVSLLHFDGEDGGVDFTDEKGNVLNKFGTPTTVTSNKMFGTSSAYLKSSDRLELSGVEDPILGEVFTLEFFLNPVSVSSTSYIMSSNGANHFYIRMQPAGGGITLTIAGSLNMVATTVIGLNVFSHVALTRDDNNDFRFFIDGVLQGSPSNTTRVIGSGSFWLSGNSTTVGAQPSEIYIDEFRFTKGVARYTENFTPPTAAFPNHGIDTGPGVEGDVYWDNVVSLLHFEGEDGGTVFTDEKGNVCTPFGNIHTDTSVPLMGQSSAKLDGTADALRIADSPGWDFDKDDFTIEFFVNHTTTKNVAYVNSRYSVGGWGIYSFSGSLHLISGSNTILSPSWAYELNTTYHIALTRRGNLFTFFVDGAELPSAVSDISVTKNTGSFPGLVIGSEYNGSYVSSLDGYIDELRITKGVARYTENFTTPTEPFPNFGSEPTPTPLPTTIGEAFGGGFYAGDIEYPDGQWYKLIVADKAADITGENSRWKTSNSATAGTDSLTDGVANTDAMITAGIELHPAASHCIDHRGGGNADWYMPARDELDLIYQNLGYLRPNCPPDFLSGGPQAFINDYYYASSEYPTEYAWFQRFSDGHQSYDIKISTIRRVRPVRRIAFTPPPPPLPTVIGEPYGGGYYIGDIVIADGGADDGTYAVIMAGLEGEAPTTSRWKTSNTATSGTDSLTDGLTNTLAMEIAGLEAHPAASYCLSYAGGGNVDWYLPAIDELGLVWTNMSLLSTLEISSSQRYWSSSEQTFNLASLWYFLNGAQEGGLKANPYYVRPVRRIKRS